MSLRLHRADEVRLCAQGVVPGGDAGRPGARGRALPCRDPAAGRGPLRRGAAPPDGNRGDGSRPGPRRRRDAAPHAAEGPLPLLFAPRPLPARGGGATRPGLARPDGPGGAGGAAVKRRLDTVYVTPRGNRGPQGWRDPGGGGRGRGEGPRAAAHVFLGGGLRADPGLARADRGLRRGADHAGAARPGGGFQGRIEGPVSGCGLLRGAHRAAEAGEDIARSFGTGKVSHLRAVLLRGLRDHGRR